MRKSRKAFTMIELVFVIAIIGILSAIAIPKFAMTRNDAVNTKGKSVLAAVRSSLAMERQKRILRGDFTAITSLGSVFTNFSAAQDGSTPAVIEYPPTACTSGKLGCWTGSGTTYTFKPAGGGTNCTYTLGSNKFTGTCAAFD